MSRCTRTPGWRSVGQKATRLALGLQLGAITLLGAQPGPTRYFPERPTGFVTDLAGVLDQSVVAQLTGRIERLKASTGAEIAVVTLPTIGDYPPVEVAAAIGRRWGVGAEAEAGDPTRNAGLVLLLVPRRADDPNSGHLFIATGKGLEGIVTDAATGRIRDRMIPLLADQELGEGLALGVNLLAERIEAGMNPGSGAEESEDPGGGLGSLAILVIVVVIIVVFVALRAAAQAGQGKGKGKDRRRRQRPDSWWGGGFGGGMGGGFGGGFGGGGGGGGFGGFGGGGGFSGGGAGGRF